MPASTFARPSQLHLCSSQAPRFERAPWSTSSDSDEDETTSADSNEDPEVDRDDEPSFDGPSTSPAPHMMTMRSAPALPNLGVRTGRTTSPPRSSPLSPLASSSSSVPSTAGTFPSSARPVRPRGLGMSPLSPTSPRPGLGKATPLSRTLLTRSMPSPAAAPKKTTKFIVPQKPFRSTFELALTSTELARK